VRRPLSTRTYIGAISVEFGALFFFFLADFYRGLTLTLCPENKIRRVGQLWGGHT
jgi:hypothetical protein